MKPPVTLRAQPNDIEGFLVVPVLERALSAAADRMNRVKGYVGVSAYTYGGQKTVHAEINDAVAAARAAL